MIRFIKKTNKRINTLSADRKKARLVSGYHNRGVELAAFLTAEFGIEHFFLAPCKSLEKLGIPEAALFDAAKLEGVRNWILIYNGELDVSLQKTVYERGGMCVAVTDLITLFENSTPGKLPMVLNEIGNDYAVVTVCGAGKKADQVYAYLKEQYHVEVKRVMPKELARAIDPNIDEVILIADLLPDLFKLLGLSKTIYIPWQRIVGKVRMTDEVFDITQRIIPMLLRQGVQVACISMPHFSELKHHYLLMAAAIPWKRLRKKDFNRYILETCKHFHTEELAQELFDIKYLRDKGYTEMFHNGNKVNFDNGYRRTVGCKADYKKRILLFGPCIIQGSFVSDENTIASIMQSRLGDDYLLINRGYPTAIGLNLLMRHTEFRPGDTVLYFGQELSIDGCVNHNLTDTYNRIPHLEKHITDSQMHCDACVNRQIAEDLCELFQKNFANRPLPAKQESFVFGAEFKTVPELYMLKNPEFEEYIASIRPFRKPGHNGSIVMNCNPFTNGHLYLVTEAARMVDTLYVFVVEEDKSFFPFKDRIELVRQGTKHLNNVCVLNSGHVFVSTATIPGYFESKRPGDIYLDASNDMMLFLQIASEMDIHVRFAGSEPLDKYTNQYNKNMRTYLVRYGVDFLEIERKHIDGEVISATHVRKYLEKKDFNTIRKIVPETTYRYLVENYGA